VTDAERIAWYIRAFTMQTWDTKDIERILEDDAAFAPGSYYDHVKRLAAMLSDVRREERGAIRASVDERTNDRAYADIYEPNAKDKL
jgi:hypothetical protein